METIEKYKTDELRHNFPKMVAALIQEMEESGQGNISDDVLGNFYELQFCRKGAGQFFTPMPICEFMAACVSGNEPVDEPPRPLRIIDPTCGSGRMLLCYAKQNGKQHHYFGIEIDRTCAKMTALNLFLNGIFNAEIMCADALSPTSFFISYRLSFLPLGIFRITEREDSPLWHAHKEAFYTKPQVDRKPIILPSESGDSGFDPGASQMSLF
ncbi:MAG: SAM-dependent DNA methyltransferase [Bacteroidetes bacterium]|nr:SAM-dependent DNA methyltransferase [Bacteroidota bacterium]